jgi:UDP-glucose 4-epimerase
MVLALTGSTAGIQYLAMRRGETPTHIVATGEGWDLLDWSPTFNAGDLYDTVMAYESQAVAA